MNTFGERLKNARRRMQLSQKEVSSRIGMSQPLLSELENDEYTSSSFTLQLANLYCVNPLWLADGKGIRELSDNDQIIKLSRVIENLPAADKALLNLLLSPEDKPKWLNAAICEALERTKQLIRQQLIK